MKLFESSDVEICLAGFRPINALHEMIDTLVPGPCCGVYEKL